MENNTSDCENDLELIRKICDGNKKSGREFIEKYSKFIYAALSKIDLRSSTVELEDLFNDVLCKLFENEYKVLRQFKGSCKLSSYIYLVARNHAIDVAKSENKMTSATDRELFPDQLFRSFLVPVNEITDEHIKVYRKAFDSINPKDQLFLKMVVNEMRSTTEIMNFFGWNSDNSVYSKKNKIIAKLRTVIRKDSKNRGLFYENAE